MEPSTPSSSAPSLTGQPAAGGYALPVPPSLPPVPPAAPGHPPAYPPAPPPRSSSTLLTVLLVLLALGFFGSLGLNLLLTLAVAGQDMAGAERFMERNVSGSGPDKLLHLRLDGVITSGSEDFSPFINDQVVIRMLDQAAEDDAVKAVVLELNTPGGELTASDRIAERVRRFIADKPLHVLMGDVCASGGYYIAAPASRVWAHPTTLTGSIGVIIRSYNLEKLLQVVGVREVVFKSGAMKDILSMSRPVTEPERQVVQGLVDTYYGRFIDIVVDGRSLEREAVKPLADGRIFDAQMAVRAGLVDEVGYFDDVQDALEEQLGLERARVITYRKPFSLFSLAESRLAAPDLATRLALWMSRPRVLALWQPE